VIQVTAQGARKREHKYTFPSKCVIEAVIVLLSRLKRSNSPKTDQLNVDRPSLSSPGPERPYLPVLLSSILIVLLHYVQPVSSTNLFEVHFGTMPNAEGRKVALITGMYIV
jgi:hypothetical protein